MKSLNFLEIDDLKGHNKSLNSKNENCFLNDILPYKLNEKSKANLRVALREYKTLLNIFDLSLTALSRLKLERFDALVGENACQIRALWTGLIILNRDVRINFLKSQIEILKKKIDHLMSCKITFEQLFKEENLFLKLKTEEFFIFLNFLLTEVKTCEDTSNDLKNLFFKEKCNPKILKKFGEISSEFSYKLVRNARKKMAALTVEFIQITAKVTNDKNVIKMLSDQYKVKHNQHLLSLPMFWSYKAVLAAIKKLNIPILIRAKFIKKIENKYQITDEDWLPLNVGQKKERRLLHDFYYVIEGAVVLPEKTHLADKEKWKLKMSQFPPESIILGAAADHRQYPDLKLDEYFGLLKNSEIQKYKLFAHQEGFSAQNPSTFFIRHVYLLAK